MTTHRTFKTVLLAGALMSALAVPALAQAPGMMMEPQVQPQSQEPPQVPAHRALEQQQEGNITYISGGIGDAEKEQLEAEKTNYNFRMINSDPTGHYVASVNVTIESRDGREVIRIASTGPLFYAQLPAGSYHVTAVNGGQQETRNIKVSASTPTDIHLVWK